jgi:hypothetical protein
VCEHPSSSQSPAGSGRHIEPPGDMVNPVKPWTFARHSVGLLEKIDVFLRFFSKSHPDFIRKLEKS